MQGWLKNTVIVVDPCVNPDGHDRYVNWYNRVRNQAPNPAPDAWEHHEPWPGGRYNHYYFDLNRDWAWQTQQESRQRIALYNQWLPQVHADFHEMGAEQLVLLLARRQALPRRHHALAAAVPERDRRLQPGHVRQEQLAVLHPAKPTICSPRPTATPGRPSTGPSA
ncbi:MAG: M14 family zinc carboxypeptidase [Hymenobacter sp.]